MALIVQKFGGTSVADAERLRNVARIITDTYQKGNSVVAVLSAQGDTTDDLIEKAAEINPSASMAIAHREQDICSPVDNSISSSRLDALGLISAAFSIRSSVVSPWADSTATTLFPF